MDIVKNRYYYSISTLGFSNTLRCRDCGGKVLVMYSGYTTDVDIDEIHEVTQKHDKEAHSELTVFKVYNTTSTGIESQYMNMKTHKLENCEGEYCVIHRPSVHHMRFWPIMFSPAKSFLAYRMCAHAKYHPDPDSFAHGIQAGVVLDTYHASCCGCCKGDQ